MRLLDGSTQRFGPVCRDGCYLHSFYCWGEFDGGEACVQASPDGETWFTIHRFREKGYRTIGLTMPFLRGRVEGGDRPEVHLVSL